MMESMTFDHWLSLAMMTVFLVGYALIAFEHVLKVNKATIALLVGVICWCLQFFKDGASKMDLEHPFGDYLSHISQVVFFILGALTIVEIMNVHRAFDFLSNFFTVRSKKKFLWLISFITFFMSSVLDNLTTTIVMATLAGKFLEDEEDRWLVGGAVVIAANAGGAWTPIGDVTTTMLWIGGQLTSGMLMRDLFLPSLFCMLFAVGYISKKLQGNLTQESLLSSHVAPEPRSRLIFALGMGSLMFVPIFKTYTGLPPFMGVLLGLSVLWIVTDLIHSQDDRCHLRVPNSLSRIDHAATLFFLGILLAVASLDAAGILKNFAHSVSEYVPDERAIAVLIGFASAIVDNVPIVAASMGMYSMATYPPDSPFWDLVAFCAGTGGSILIIGSAAGVAYMSIERVSFMWYAKNIGLAATLGYFGGILVYLLQSQLL